MKSRLIPFCSVCVCGKKSAEYEAYPQCEGCSEYTCPDCTSRNGKDADVDQAPTVICKPCATAAMSYGHALDCPSCGQRITVDLHPSEPQTRDHPGAAAYVEPEECPFCKESLDEIDPDQIIKDERDAAEENRADELRDRELLEREKP